MGELSFYILFIKDNICRHFEESYCIIRDKHKDATLLNLNKYNLPFADEKHLLLKTGDDKTDEGKITKEKRRIAIEKEYNILLLIGDQMADFDQAFDVFNGGSEAQITDSVVNYAGYFGDRFILMPNPVYCDWLRHLMFGHVNKHLSINQMDSIRNTFVSSWK